VETISLSFPLLKREETMNVVRPIFRSTTLTGGKSGAAAGNSLKYSALYALDVLFNISFSFPARTRLVDGLNLFERVGNGKVPDTPESRSMHPHECSVINALRAVIK
jgi:hypothetical protein